MKEGDEILYRSFNNDPVSDGVRLARDIVDIPDILEVSLVEVLVGEDGIPVEEEFRLDPAWGPIETQRRLDEWRGDRYSVNRGLPRVPGEEVIPEHWRQWQRIEALTPGQRKCYDAYVNYKFREFRKSGGQ